MKSEEGFLMVTPVTTKITAAEYFLLPETNLPMELIDREIIRMPSPTIVHQRVIVRLVLLFAALVERVGGECFVAPLDVHLDDGNVVQPDFLWIAPGSACVVGEKRLTGAPDVLVEVISAGNASHDRKTKFRLYQKYGVREYWLIDPVEQLIEVFQWIDGRFHLLDVVGADEAFQSPLMGEIVVAGLFS